MENDIKINMLGNVTIPMKIPEGNNPAIISKEMYQAVQIEKQHRSNVIEGDEGNKLKSKKYGSKK